MNNIQQNLDKVDRMIKDFLKKSSQPISTYDIAKRLNISWSTANTHCYRLMAYGVIASKNEEVRISVKRVVWWYMKPKDRP
jgi:predicted transcriptional regulator